MIGRIKDDLLEALLETLPLEISVLDGNDKVLAWNKHETRFFKRPEAALGRDVRDCHPKKSLGYVERIISEMKEGTRDKARFWIDLPLGPEGDMQKILIEYFALRDGDGKYLGCLEATQNITEIRALSGQKRLLD